MAGKKELTNAKVWESVKSVLGHDRDQYWIVLVFAVQAGALTLAIPLAVQMFVNSVTFIGTTQPIYILTFVLFGVLAISGFIQLLKFITVEKLEQRLFALNLVRFLEAIPNFEPHPEQSRTEVANRFWELISVQKNIKSIFIEALAIALQMGSGILLISFYHPWLLLYGFLLVICVYWMVKSTRLRSLQLRYQLSHSKHLIARYSQEIATHPAIFSNQKACPQLLQTQDRLLETYLDDRKNYFAAVLTQNIGLLTTYVVGSSILLGIGGFLVLKEQLALGQLVASEIVISSVLYNLWKFGLKIESIDSFFVSSVKLNDILKQAETRSNGFGEPTETADSDSKRTLRLNNIRDHSIYSSQPLDLELNLGQILVVSGPPGSGKSHLASVISGKTSPDEGFIELRGLDIRNAFQNGKAKDVISLSNDELFFGTILENLSCLSHQVSEESVRELLRALGALDDISKLEHGLETIVDDHTSLLSNRVRVLISLARVTLAKPAVMVVDDLFDSLDAKSRSQAIAAIRAFHPDLILVICTAQDHLEVAAHQRVSLRHE